jgi:hypothetical protein
VSGRPARDADYRAARTGAAAALTGVMIVLLLVDAMSPEYEAAPFALVVLATLIASLLAVDLPDLIRRGPP